MSVFSRASAVSSMGFVNGTLRRSILWPSSASTAISSEFAIRTVVSTPSELPIPSFVTKSSPMNASPETEIATVSPAKRTARPADEPASAAATRGGKTVVEQLSEPRHDEQRVVDPDPEPDHRDEDRRHWC